jgi:hypothetical protein
MQIKIYSAFLFFFLFVASLAMSQSQIIDDSTKQVYGPHTTYYRTFEEILNNKDQLTKVDSTIGKMHRFSMVEKSDYRYQNLGNLGTALRPVFYEMPTQVGIRSGYDAYIPYYLPAEKVAYFDTKSAYTPLDVVVGANGRAVTHITHARNITPYWNAGVHFKKINADKQVASAGRNDNQTSSTAYYVHMDYQSPNGKYQGLMSLSRINHKVWEQGGIAVEEGAPVNDYFDDNANVRLYDAQSQDFRIGAHVYNHYKIRNVLQVYHSFQYIQNRNFYRNNPLLNDRTFYDQVLINTDSTTDETQTNQLINEFGVKGDYTNMFYRFYVKLRDVRHRNRYLADNQLFFENSGGFELRYDFDSLQNIRGSGEYIMGGYYRFGGSYFNKFFTLEYWRTQSRPAIIESRYFGNHFEWENSFATPASDLLRGSLIYANKHIRIEPFASVTNVKNNIYYGYDQKPTQAEGSAQILGFGANLDFTVARNIHWDNSATYTTITGDAEAVNALRIPEIFVNSRLYYGGYWFGEAIYIMFGVDANYRSDLYAPAYSPVLQQFYLQDEFLVEAYLKADAFVEFQIGDFSMFLKMEHINEPSNRGYFTHPYYRGMGRIFDIGIRWMFFD